MDVTNQADRKSEVTLVFIAVRQNPHHAVILRFVTQTKVRCSELRKNLIVIGRMRRNQRLRLSFVRVASDNLPRTGSPLSFSSASITFHLPTSFSLSTGVSLLSMIVKLGRLASVSFILSVSAIFFGFGPTSLAMTSTSTSQVLLLLMTGSGIR